MQCNIGIFPLFLLFPFVGCVTAGSLEAVEVRSRGRLIRSGDPPPHSSTWQQRHVEVSPHGITDGETGIGTEPVILRHQNPSADEEAAEEADEEPADEPADEPVLSQECITAKRKAARLLRLANLTRVNTTLQRLEAVGREKGFLALVLNKLAEVSFHAALGSGEVWTVDDQHDLSDDCITAGTVKALEEHSRAEVGEAILEGDMLATVESMNRVASTGKPPRLSERNWANGIIPYCFAAGTSATARRAFQVAARRIHEQVPCIAFQQTKVLSRGGACEEIPSILVSSKLTGCWSHVGCVSHHVPSMRNLSQKLNLGKGCTSVGAATHQLGHAMGMVHEVSRNDRDEHLNILVDNMDAFSWESNLPKDLDAPGPTGQHFDMLSIMMSGAHTFSENGKATLKPKKRRLGTLIGQRMSLSEIDVQRLGERYNCSSSIAPTTQNKRLSLLLLNDTGCAISQVCADMNYTGVLSKDLAGQMKHVHCTELHDRCSDPEVGERMRLRCPATCIQCIPVSRAARNGEVAEEEDDDNEDEASGVSSFLSLRLAPGSHDVPAEGNTSLQSNCLDANFTHIYHRKTGAAAKCTELTAYCTHHTLGASIQKACPVACGQCLGAYQANGSSILVPVPSWKCNDKSKTGIAFPGGSEATCQELVHYCNHASLGQRVQEVCTMTCGRCEVEVSANASANASSNATAASNATSNSTAECKDQSMFAKPVFYMGPQRSSCSEIADFCTGHPDSEWVQMKCPQTCRLCDEAGAAEEEEEPQQQAAGHCSTRRRWGNCATRRRRDD